MNKLKRQSITDPAARGAIRKEGSRRLVVKLIFFIFALFVIEGALRKWIFPSMHRYIFFIKDPFVFIVYLIAVKNNLFPKKEKIFIVGLAMASAFLLLILWQSVLTDINPVVSVYGWRMYFYYLPLSFIIGENFRGKELYYFMRYALLLAIPMGVLSFLQYSSSPGSFWNSTPLGIAYTESGVSGGQIARLTATFSFFHAMQLYIGFMIALTLSMWSLPKNKKPLKGMLFFIASIAVIAMFGMDITRLPTMLAMIIILAYIGSIFIVTEYRTRIRIIRFIAFLVLIAMIVGGGFLFKSSEIRESRFKGKEDYLKRRTTSMFYVDRKIFEGTPYFGDGLGATSRGAAEIARVFGIGKIELSKAPGENEWSRIIVESGSVGGVVYILYRWALFLVLLAGAIRATRRSSNTLPLLLVAFIAPILIVWYMTAIGQVNSFAWLCIGLCLAANKLVDTWRTGDEKMD